MAGSGAAGNGTRAVTLVGPQGAGKTSLLEALVHRAGALKQQGRVADGSSLGDASQEARDFRFSTEPNFAHCKYLDEDWAIIDCPGSIELLQDSLGAMLVADIVIVVAPPEPDRAMALSPYLHFLDQNQIPHALFLSRMDETENRVRDLLQAFQEASDRPLVLRQVPIREGDKIVGAVDLVSERAWRYREQAPAELIQMPDTVRDREEEGRETLLETLADFDDALMEELLEDRVPVSDDVYKHLTRDLADDLIVPVFLGSGVHGHGITRLWKFLRHEAPAVAQTAERLGIANDGSTQATVLKTLHLPHAGKLSISRVWTGTVKDGDSVADIRMSGLQRLNGGNREKIAAAPAGDIVGLPRLDPVMTGAFIRDGAVVETPPVDFPAALPPVLGKAVQAKTQADQVKIGAALHRLAEEDPSLHVDRREEGGEMVLAGQGDMHLRLAFNRLETRFKLAVDIGEPRALYRETIRGATDQHARHKKQTGGHGQFADIKVSIRPLERGEGFRFEDKVTGGAVPRQFIPAVEAGVREAMEAGPLGFPVVDFAVSLHDGQHHSVDSSEMAFKIAARQAMADGLPECQPVLLEPIHEVAIAVPNSFTSRVNAVISGRRGQILGFDGRPGWKGWDEVRALMPEASLADLIIELRSLTQGLATFEAKFDHYQELYGREADEVVAERRRQLAG